MKYGSYQPSDKPRIIEIFRSNQINTPQLMEKLFNRYGFETYQTIKDGFGQELDEYKMRKLT